MAIEFVNSDTQEIQGLSTDTKPTAGIMPGSGFHELDTQKVWTFSENINPATSNGWWE